MALHLKYSTLLGKLSARLVSFISPGAPRCRSEECPPENTPCHWPEIWPRRDFDYCSCLFLSVCCLDKLPLPPKLPVVLLSEKKKKKNYFLRKCWLTFNFRSLDILSALSLCSRTFQPNVIDICLSIKVHVLWEFRGRVQSLINLVVRE